VGGAARARDLLGVGARARAEARARVTPGLAACGVSRARALPSLVQRARASCDIQ